MSASPNSTTEVSVLHSLSESEAFFSSAFLSSFLSASSFLSLGSPSGKAVLNLPVRRMARL